MPAGQQKMNMTASRSALMDDEEMKEVIQTLHTEAGIDYNRPILRNCSKAVLYEEALKFESGTAIMSSGALAAFSGAKTGRSPKDKRIVDDPSSSADVWWGPVNIKLDDKVFMINRERAIDYLNTRDRLYVVDGYAGHDPKVFYYKNLGL